jgi:hypothetical protein
MGMENQSEICPRCGSELAEPQGGFRRCPACGFEEEPQTAAHKLSGRGSPGLFWVLLVAPAAMSLTGFVTGVSRDTALHTIGLAICWGAVLLGALSPIYTGIWLARRFIRPGGARVLGGLALIVVIGTINLFIAAAGCVPTTLNDIH